MRASCPICFLLSLSLQKKKKGLCTNKRLQDFCHPCQLYSGVTFVLLFFSLKTKPPLSQTNFVLFDNIASLGFCQASWLGKKKNRAAKKSGFHLFFIHKKPLRFQTRQVDN